MSQANIKSLDSIQRFREDLIAFLSRFSRSFEQVGEEVRRAQAWLEVEQWQNWSSQVKKRRRMLDQAQSELLSAKMSEFIESPQAQQMYFRKCKAAVQEAEEKLSQIRRWMNQLPTSTDSLLRSTTSLRFNVEGDLRKGIAYLEQILRILDQYSKPGETPTT